VRRLDEIVLDEVVQIRCGNSNIWTEITASWIYFCSFVLATYCIWSDLQVRGGRQNWGSYAVYRGGWGPQRELRGRRGGHRIPGGRRPSSRSGGEWGQGSESELSGDEVSASTESGKEDAGRVPGSRRVDRERDARRPPRWGCASAVKWQIVACSLYNVLSPIEFYLCLSSGNDWHLDVIKMLKNNLLSVRINKCALSLWGAHKFYCTDICAQEKPYLSKALQFS